MSTANQSMKETNNVVCSVKGCKSSWKKHLRITFHRFPSSNEKYFHYWIATAGREDLVSFLNARICSLHFTNNDYFNDTKHVGKNFLKPYTFPTQHVHKNIVQLLAKADEINENNNKDLPIINEERTTTNNQNDKEKVVTNQNDMFIDEEQTTTNSQNNKEEINQNNMLIDEEQTTTNSQNNKEEINQNNMLIDEEQTATNSQNNKEEINQNDMLIDKEQSVSSVISKYINCEKLKVQNKMLQHNITNLEISQEKRLEQQANMFHIIINKNKAELKKNIEF
ncbi:probable serine/threonine-protein kinase DDB_G0283337 isoform X1 [Linepithema humile]|uniref:probable serine/threonine-protein kinase DDB_G0283337 isoform X1 n=1 Tax=Linepithema humile TaxID=83485 RepID=UPI00351DDD26